MRFIGMAYKYCRIRYFDWKYEDLGIEYEI